MKLRIGIAALLVVAVAAIGGAIARGGSGQAKQHPRWGMSAVTTEEAAPASAAVPAGATELNLVQVFSPRAVEVDVGAPGLDPGDYNVFEDPVFNEDESQRVGRLHVSCLAAFTADLCRGNLELTRGDLRGKIAFDGKAAAPPFLLPITGGTNDFKRVRGQARLQPLRDDAFAIQLRLFLK